MLEFRHTHKEIKGSGTQILKRAVELQGCSTLLTIHRNPGAITKSAFVRRMRLCRGASTEILVGREWKRFAVVWSSKKVV